MIVVVTDHQENVLTAQEQSHLCCLFVWLFLSLVAGGGMFVVWLCWITVVVVMGLVEEVFGWETNRSLIWWGGHNGINNPIQYLLFHLHSPFPLLFLVLVLVWCEHPVIGWLVGWLIGFVLVIDGK